MSAPCARPECGGEVHADQWGNAIQCPLAYELCELAVGKVPHDAHAWGTGGCDGWMPDDGTHPEAPPEPSELDGLRADVESLRYQIRRAREALAEDEPGEVADLRNAVANIRALHTEEYGCCSHCTRADAAPYPCPTIRVLDGEAP